MNHKPGKDFKKHLKMTKGQYLEYIKKLQINAKNPIENQAKIMQVFPKRKKQQQLINT